MVETKAVSKAMQDVGDCIKQNVQCDEEKLASLCRALGTAMAKSLAETATMNYEEFSKNQFSYLNE